MALISALGYLATVLMLACLGLAFGTRMLRWFGICADSRLEQALYAEGAFFVLLQVLVFILGFIGWLRALIVLVMLAAMALLAGREWLQVTGLAGALRSSVRRAAHSYLTLVIVGLTALCVVVDAALAMAPLTGSDALLYHFTAPMLEVGRQWQPVFWLAMSFYAGFGHVLIGLGMTLGSDHLSTGLIYLSGILTAGSLFVLTRRLSSERWAWVASLSFLLTPMVYWQMSTSGCPDMWMAFYITLLVLAAARAVETGTWQWWVLAGLFAGAVAGVKYTAWTIPAVLILYCLIATRSLKRSAICAASSLAAGVFPLARNAWWTGDPFFPYLVRWVRPSQFNPYAYQAILDGLHPAGSSRTLVGLFEYPFVFPLSANAYGGFGHFWGPLVLALTPLLVFTAWKNPLVIAAIGAWFTVLLTNEMTAQQPRYLLPAFPLALALVFAAVAEAYRRRWRGMWFAALASVSTFLLFGIGSEALYARDFLPVVVGLEQREHFLQRMAPDYPAVSFINRSLEGANGRTMVFFHHVYYLQVPFEIGDPAVSWLIDPERLSRPDSLMQLLRQENISWVVKAPGYPEPLASAFQALEDEGSLTAVFTGDVSTFATFRLYGTRVPVHIVILQVAPTRAIAHK